MSEKQDEQPGRLEDTTVTEKQQASSDLSEVNDSDVLQVPVLADEPKIQPPTHPDLAQSQSKSVIAKTHSKKRSAKRSTPLPKLQKSVSKWVALTGGAIAVVSIVVSGVLSQYYKNKALPNVYVAGHDQSGKSAAQIIDSVTKLQKDMKVTLQTDTKKLNPNLEEIGYKVDGVKTAAEALSAKRREGVLAKIMFWRHSTIPVIVTVNDTLLAQYIETNVPELITPPTDSTLTFDAKTASFSVTDQANGKGADLVKLKTDLVLTGHTLSPATLQVRTAPKGPGISEADLEPLVEPANKLVSHTVTLTGIGYRYTTRAADIASWITPTPRSDGSVRLVIDPAKIQSYVEGIGKRISNPPLDTKVIKDDLTGQEVVLQQGRDGTELADKQNLSNAIANGLAAGKDVTEVMNIQVAAHKTVNMSSYDKWIEVDLSEQRTTAYERANPIKTFTIASGVRDHPTVKGEFAIWLKVRSQTMQGGSKADGSYYSIPNVEWVSYFYQDYALHGAWWRTVFGYPASHGCVNMTNNDAHWVFDWAPVGTKVIVHD